MVFDQSVSSTVNFLPSLLVASRLSARDFGSLATLTAVVLTSQAVIRACTGEVAQVVHVDPALWTTRLRASADSAVSWISLLAALVAGATALVIGLGWPGFVVGGLFCYLYCQSDAARALLMIEGRVSRRLTANLVVLATEAGLLAVWLLVGHSSVVALIGAWSVALASGLVALRRRIQHRSPWHWIRTQSRRIRAFVLEGLAASGMPQVAFVIIASVQGLESLGGVRAATLLLLPLTFTTQVLGQFVYVLVSRRPDRSLVWWLQGAMAGISVCVFLLLETLPASWLELAVGHSWSAASKVLLPVAAYLTGSSLSLPASAYLRAVGRHGRASRIRMIIAPMGLAAAAAGSLVSAETAMVALAVMSLVVLVVLAVAVLKSGAQSNMRRTKLPVIPEAVPTFLPAED